MKRKVDEFGRIVLPAEAREQLDIREGDELEIYLHNNNSIAIKKVVPKVVPSDEDKK